MLPLNKAGLCPTSKHRMPANTPSSPLLTLRPPHTHTHTHLFCHQPLPLGNQHVQCDGHGLELGQVCLLDQAPVQLLEVNLLAVKGEACGGREGGGVGSRGVRDGYTLSGSFSLSKVKPTGVERDQGVSGGVEDGCTLPCSSSQR